MFVNKIEIRTLYKKLSYRQITLINIIIAWGISLRLAYFVDTDCNMAPVVEKIQQIPNIELGEGPHWDVASQSLYFVDIFGKAIHKYVPLSGKHSKAVFDKHVSLIVPVEGETDKFVITLERDVAIVTWDGISDKVSNIQKIGEVDLGLKTRINDGKCDPKGRLWFGTMGEEPENGHIAPSKGSFYSYSKSGINTHLTNLGISNGLAWNTELNKFYFIDSFKGTVDEFDVDLETGVLSNQKIIFTLEKHNINGFPDGMTIDVNGNLWLAVFNGYKILNIDPRQPETLIQSIDIPAKQVTSVAWGGPNLDILYVTSARFTVDGEQLLPPYHGATFKITGLRTKGLPAANFVPSL